MDSQLRRCVDVLGSELDALLCQPALDDHTVVALLRMRRGVREMQLRGARTPYVACTRYTFSTRPFSTKRMVVAAAIRKTS